MYTGLLHTHSLLRYFILISLVVVIIKAVIGLMNKEPYGKWDNKFSLYLFIFTHMQLLAGLILYFVSPFVKFGSTTMGDKVTRYWTVEHIVAMLIAVVLITLARTTSKRSNFRGFNCLVCQHYINGILEIGMSYISLYLRVVVNCAIVDQ